MKISRQDLLKVGFVSAAAGIVGVACSSDDTSNGGGGTGGGTGTTGGNTGSGGAGTTGGTKATGGAANGSGGKAATGGTASGSGGAVNNASGGKAATGGATSGSGGAATGSGGVASGTGGGSGDGGKCTADPTPMVAGNHEHPVTVPLADVIAGTAKTYTLEMGDTQHTHTLMVTPANFTTLKTTGTVTITSSTDAGHSHEVTLSCE